MREAQKITVTTESLKIC